jgi:hypothetical protein
MDLISHGDLYSVITAANPASQVYEKAPFTNAQAKRGL